MGEEGGEGSRGWAWLGNSCDRNRALVKYESRGERGGESVKRTGTNYTRESSSGARH